MQIGNDDIVTRLGKFAYRLAEDGDHHKAILIDQATNEIERLRALVEHLSAQVRLQMKANDKAWEAYKEVEGQ